MRRAFQDGGSKTSLNVQESHGSKAHGRFMRDLKKWVLVGLAVNGLACGSSTNDTVIASTPAPSPIPSPANQPSPLPSPLPRGPGLLYAQLSNSILRFSNPGSLSGNAAPQATIAGNNTRIIGLTDMVLDPRADRLYAANVADILVWDNVSTKGGNVPPDRLFNIGIMPFSVTYDGQRDVLYVGTTEGVFKVFGASAANGTLPSGLPLQGTFGGQPLFPFDMRVESVTNRLFVASCSTTGRAAGQVVAIFDNAFQSTGNSTFTAQTSALNPFRTARDNAGRLVVNDAVLPIGPGIEMSTQERILAFPSEAGGNPAPVLTITGAVQQRQIGAHQMSYDTNNDSMIVANTDKVLFFDRFTTLTGTVAASTARVLNLASFNSPCTVTALDPSR